MLLLDIQASQIRTEQYMSMMASIELCRIGIISQEELMVIIVNVTEAIKSNLERQEESKKASAVAWPAKNLAA